MGVPFPKSQPMRLYSSLWDAEEWATRGGLVKTDWSKAPFTAYYRNFNADACVWYPASGASSCFSMAAVASENSWFNQDLDAVSYRKMRWVQRKYMIYSYCADGKRFPGGRPRECRLRWSHFHWAMYVIVLNMYMISIVIVFLSFHIVSLLFSGYQ